MDTDCERLGWLVMMRARDSARASDAQFERTSSCEPAVSRGLKQILQSSLFMGALWAQQHGLESAGTGRALGRGIRNLDRSLSTVVNKGVR